MSVYPQSLEENVRDQALVRDWVKSGLLDSAQRAALETSLQVPLRRTNGALRVLLAFFTSVIVLAAAGLTAVIFDPESSTEWVVPFLWAGISGCCAWALVSWKQLYRCGVEEALAVLAVFLLSLSVGTMVWDRPMFAGVLTAALGSLGLYVVFGFRYALAAACVLAGLAPFGLETDRISERLLSLLVCALAFFVARHFKTQYTAEIQEADFAAAQGAAYATFYLACNLMITWRYFGVYERPAASEWFYWGTYVAVWIVPVLALWRGLRERDRILLDLGILSALATIVTNKTYLEWPRNTWDPLLLGVSLIVAAIAWRRWLASGPQGERSGFTPLRVLHSQNRAVDAATALSMALPQTHATSSAPTPAPTYKPGGGESGGGGASGSF